MDGRAAFFLPTFSTFRTALARRTSLLLALVALVLASAATDAGAAVNTGLLGISPPRRVEVTRPPVTLPPTIVQNTTRLTFNMTVTPGVLIQRVDGTFDIDRSPRALRAAQLMLDVGPLKFKLPPNRQLPLHFRWVTLPRGARAAYLGLLVT